MFRGFECWIFIYVAYIWRGANIQTQTHTYTATERVQSGKAIRDWAGGKIGLHCDTPEGRYWYSGFFIHVYIWHTGIASIYSLMLNMLQLNCLVLDSGVVCLGFSLGY